MSQRQTAKVLGVDESTVRADLRENPAQNAGKSRTPATRTRQATKKGAQSAHPTTSVAIQALTNRELFAQSDQNDWRTRVSR
jgi:hypothetical protein